MHAVVYQAVEMSDVTVARFLLESGAKVDEAQDLTGRKALHEAIIQGSIDMVSLLLEHGATVLHNDSDAAFRNAIRLAADAGAVETLGAVLSVVNNKDDVTAALTDPDGDGNSLLHRCAAKGSADIVRLFLEIGDSNAMLSHRNPEGHTPLHSAALQGRFEVTRLLVEHGPDPTASSKQGDSPLELSTQEWAALNISNIDFEDRQLSCFGEETVSCHISSGTRSSLWQPTSARRMFTGGWSSSTIRSTG
jgi:ankyrin repeat protein